MQDERDYYKLFKTELRRLALVPAPGSCVLAAFSGGADSLCLLDLLFRLQQEKNDFTLIAQHQQHMIRGESAERDLDFCLAFCRSRGIELLVDRADVPAAARALGMSLEEAGRFIRRRSWEQRRRELLQHYPLVRLATAHHADDQAETLLLRLERGSGLRGLAGMRPLNDYVMRPLLHFSRAMIEDYLRGRGLDWCRDETNDDSSYRRNFLRRELLPLWQREADPGLKARLAKTASLLGESLSLNDYWLKETLAEIRYYPAALFYDPSLAYYDCRALARLPESLQHALLAYVISNLLHLKDITAEHIYEMSSLAVSGGRERRLHLPQAYEMIADGRTFYFKRQEQKPEPGLPVGEPGFCLNLADLHRPTKLPGGWNLWLMPCRRVNGEEVLLYNELSELLVRTRRSRDYCTDRRGRKLWLKDCLSSARVPRDLRDRLLLICRGNEVLFPSFAEDETLNRNKSVKIGQNGAETAECFRLIWYNSRNK